MSKSIQGSLAELAHNWHTELRGIMEAAKTLKGMALHSARRTFLQELVKLEPSVYEHLEHATFPTYSKVLGERRALIRGWPDLVVTHIEGLGKRSDRKPLPCHALSDDELTALKTAVKQWGARFQIVDGWLYECAFETLDTCKVFMPLHRLEGMSLIRQANEAPPSFTVTISPTNFKGELPDPGEVKKAVDKAYRKWRKDLEGSTKPKMAQHLRWLIRHHFNGWSDNQILEEHLEITGDELSDDAVKKEVNRAATAIGFTS